MSHADCRETFFHVMYKPDGSQLIKNIASGFSGKLVLALESSGHRSMSDIIQAGVGIASYEFLVS